MLGRGHVRGVERVGRPVHHPRAALDETDRRPDGREVEEVLGIDLGNLVAAEVAEDQAERRGGGLAGVVPAVERAHEDRVAQVRAALPANRIHPGSRYPVGTWLSATRTFVQVAVGVRRPGHSYAMTSGISLFLIAVGAILYFAVNASVSGLEIDTVGLILMIVGGIGFLWSMFALYGARGREVVPAEHEVVRERRL